MERRDLIKDEIERLGKVLGKIVADLLNLKAEGKASEGMEQAQEALQEILFHDINIPKLVKLPEEEFIGRLTANPNFNANNLEQMGDIISEIGMVKIEAGHEVGDAHLYLQKALAIYEHITIKSATFSLEREEKEMRIRQFLN